MTDAQPLLLPLALPLILPPFALPAWAEAASWVLASGYWSDLGVLRNMPWLSQS